MAHTRKVARDPSVAAEAKRIASATYYQKNADIIREKRRIQMAEKRAKIKAKRRRSDKPRPPTKKQLKSVPCPRILAEAENDASDALLTMAQQPAQQPVLPPASPDLRRSENVSESNEGLDHCDIRDEIDVDAEDSDNAEAGYRTISEVAAMRCQEILIEDETAILVHGKLTPERELSIPSSPPLLLLPQNRPRYSTPALEDSPSIDWDSEPRMPSFLTYLDNHMRRRGRRVD